MRSVLAFQQDRSHRPLDGLGLLYVFDEGVELMIYLAGQRGDLLGCGLTWMECLLGDG
jgi:hypothetical protein